MFPVTVNKTDSTKVHPVGKAVKDRMNLEELADDFCKLWYPTNFSRDENPVEISTHGSINAPSNSFPPATSPEKKQEITPEDALQIVLEKYEPRQYKALWEKYCSGMKDKLVADKYDLSPKSVGQTRRRRKKESYNSQTTT